MTGICSPKFRRSGLKRESAYSPRDQSWLVSVTQHYTTLFVEIYRIEICLHVESRFQWPASDAEVAKARYAVHTNPPPSRLSRVREQRLTQCSVTERHLHVAHAVADPPNASMRPIPTDPGSVRSNLNAISF